MTTYAFGEYELDLQRYDLRCAGNVLKIEPQVFNVLAYLVQHRDHTVTRQELLEHLWPEPYISDTVVSYCIMAARKAVGDSGRAQQIIKTVHGRGFRFVAPFQERRVQASADEVLQGLTMPETAARQSQQTLFDTAQGAAACSTPESAPGHRLTLVTVLCATLAQTTTLAIPQYFDELQRLRQGFFAAAQRMAQQYRGTLRFFGADGILLLFHEATEEDVPAERAVRAAMALHQHLPRHAANRQAPQMSGLAIRLGLHTGIVPLDALSDDGQSHALPTGETLHLAVWLQYLTEPGTLRISEATMRLLPAEVPQATRREVRVPGQPHPIQTYVLHVSV